MGYNVNEGVTEYFTRKLGPEVQVVRDDSSFLRQYTSTTHLVTAATEPVVAAAYFDGDIAALEAAMRASRRRAPGQVARLPRRERLQGRQRAAEVMSADAASATVAPAPALLLVRSAPLSLSASRSTATSTTRASPAPTQSPPS